MEKAKTTMNAVIFKGPYKVAVEDRPIPKLKEPTDIIVKVHYSALCGSELHVFRGREPSPTDFIMGHEFTGTVEEIGSHVKNFQKGDQIVRVPLADTTAVKAPEGIVDNALVLMADIFPTGYFAANNVFKDMTNEQIADATVVLIGCGPVGLCALINAETYKPKHLLAVDSVQSRLDLAESLGAEPWNFETDREGLKKRMEELTEGRGADAIIEVVGTSPALKMGFELMRPWGVISSVGVHNAERCRRDLLDDWLEFSADNGSKNSTKAQSRTREHHPPPPTLLFNHNYFKNSELLYSSSASQFLGRNHYASTLPSSRLKLQLPLLEAIEMATDTRTETDLTGLSDSMTRVGVNGGDDNRVGPDGEGVPRTDEEYAQSQMTLRAIVSSKEAGVIIGKEGKNVADLRTETGVKAGVSKVVQGVHDRVLTVTGGLEQISKAYSIVCKGLLEGAPQMGMGGVISTNGTHPIRLLISHNQMGTIIGRQGLKIKHIQDVSGVRMVAQKDTLPQSTERIVEVQGTPEGIQKATWEIGKCLVDDWQRGTGTVLYNPAVRAEASRGGLLAGPLAGAPPPYGGNRSFNRTGNGTDFSDNSYRRSNQDSGNRGPPTTTEDGEEIQTQNISIPSDMVGCIIGRGGSKISEIRKTSGARISIAKAPHDETGERMFTIMGSAGANEKALYLLYENLEAEKMRRSTQPPQE
ncbi:MAG: hypothetical protein Q9163_005395 [Psora crenata]